LLHALTHTFTDADIYLQLTELREVYNIRLQWRGVPRNIALANIAKACWILLGAPLIIIVWRACGFTLESVYGILENSAIAVFVPVLSCVALLAAAAVLFLLRKPRLALPSFEGPGDVSRPVND
jgi:hypothetical protein